MDVLGSEVMGPCHQNTAKSAKSHYQREDLLVNPMERYCVWQAMAIGSLHSLPELAALASTGSGGIPLACRIAQCQS